MEQAVEQNLYCNVRLCEQKNKDALCKYSNAFQTSISNEIYILVCVRRQTKATPRNAHYEVDPSPPPPTPVISPVRKIAVLMKLKLEEELANLLKRTPLVLLADRLIHNISI